MTAPGNELARLLKPRPGEAYVYRQTDEGKRDAGYELVVTATSMSERDAIRIKETPRFGALPVPAGLILPPGASIVAPEYVLSAAGGALTKTSPDGRITVVMREPLRVGTTGWSRAMEFRGPNAREYTGACHITARYQSMVLGQERSTIGLAYQLKLPEEEIIVTEQYAFDVGLVRWQADFRVDGMSTGVCGRFLEQIVAEESRF